VLSNALTKYQLSYKNEPEDISRYVLPVVNSSSTSLQLYCCSAFIDSGSWFSGKAPGSCSFGAGCCWYAPGCCWYATGCCWYAAGWTMSWPCCICPCIEVIIGAPLDTLMTDGLTCSHNGGSHHFTCYLPKRLFVLSKWLMHRSMHYTPCRTFYWNC